MTMNHAPAIARTLTWVLLIVLGAWLLTGSPALAQQSKPSVLDAMHQGQVEVEVFGRSPSFNQPMLALRATNRGADPISLALPPGLIFRSRDPRYCDVVVLAAEPPLVLAAGQGQTALSGVYGYCLQPAPGERLYPPQEAAFDVTGETGRGPDPTRVGGGAEQGSDTSQPGRTDGDLDGPGHYHAGGAADALGICRSQRLLAGRARLRGRQTADCTDGRDRYARDSFADAASRRNYHPADAGACGLDRVSLAHGVMRSSHFRGTGAAGLVPNSA